MANNKYSIFIDESGMGDPKTYKISPYYSLCALVVPNERRETLKTQLEELKLKYFGSKNYVIHNSEIKRDLRHRRRSLENFSKEIKKILSPTPFFLLTVIVDKKKAFERSWLHSTVYEKTSKFVIGEIIKFLVAKKAQGSIYIEASEAEKDLITYKSFFHYLANGIPTLTISSEEVKLRTTSLCFVTKFNNDAEEQLTDIFACSRIIKTKIESNISKIEKLDSFDSTILAISKSKYFIPSSAKKLLKMKLYGSINSLAILP